MSDARGPARLPKLPFYIADAVLSAIIVFVLYRLGTFEGPWEMAIVAAAIFGAVIAAWISIIPWLSEQKAAVRLAESEDLASSVQQIQRVEEAATSIRHASSQWQGVQETASKTMAAAREISDKMRAEAQDFMQFVEKAHDQERAHLRLEVEKLKKMEGEWLKVLVQIMDHVFALHEAGARSGQPALVSQLGQFQGACRDVARRIGLVPFLPAIGEPYDERGHQLPDPKFKAPDDAKVGQVLATGFMYQGQLLRRSLVLLANPDQEEQPAAAAAEPAPAPENQEPSPGELEPASEPAPPEAPGPEQPSDPPAPEPKPAPEKNPEQLRLV